MKSINRFLTIIVVCLMVLSTLTLSAGAGRSSGVMGKKQSVEISISYSGGRQCYYSKPYIFDICWNISDKTANLYNRKNIDIDDKNTITVWYGNGLKKRLNDKGVALALADVLGRISAENSKMEKPMVIGIINVGNASPKTLVKQYYKSGDLACFDAVFPFADSKTQSMFLKKAYDDESAAFFSICLDNLDDNSVEKYIEKYAAKAYDDESAAFFSICLDNLDDNFVEKYIEKYAAKAYDDESAAFFSICLDSLEDNSVERYVEKYAAKAYNDGTLTFFSICFDYLDSSAAGKHIQKYAEKSYNDDRLAFFSVLSYEMSNEQLEFWFDRASEDGKISFKALCECDDYDDWDNDF